VASAALASPGGRAGLLVVALVGLLVLACHLFVLGGPRQGPRKIVLLMVGAFAVVLGRYGAAWLAPLWDGLAAFLTAAPPVALAWYLLSRPAIDPVRLAGRHRVTHAAALAAVVAACALIPTGAGDGARRPKQAESGAAPVFYPSLGIATAGGVTWSGASELTPANPTLSRVVDVKGPGSVCEVALYGTTPSGDARTVACVVGLTPEDGEQRLLVREELALPMEAWRTFRFDISQYEGQTCRVTVGAGADGDFRLLQAGTSYQLRPPEAYNAVLVSLDGLRADHLGCYGYARPTSPAIDGLAREGVRFERCNAQAPWALPSLFSMLAGEAPSALWADQPLLVAARRFCGAAPTVARILKVEGYRTAAITDGGAPPQCGLYQGFDTYEVCSPPGAETTAGRVREWLAQYSDTKFFLFIQSDEPNLPYEGRQFTPPSREPEDVVAAFYDGDVYRADQLVGEILAELERLGLSDRTLMVVTSAHGQEFRDLRSGEVVTFGHTLRQDVLHVPLVMWAPGLVPAGKVVASRVGVMDVGPTIAGLLGYGETLRSLGLPGVDLSGIITGSEAPGEERAIFSEATTWGPERKALVRGRYKLVYTPIAWDRLSPGERAVRTPPLKGGGKPGAGWSGPQVELYDLEVDPGEEHNIAADSPEIVEEHMALLESILERNSEQRRLNEPYVMGWLPEESGGVPARHARPASVGENGRER